MHAFAPRRSTDTEICDAITLGWRIASLYCLRAKELPRALPDNLLPARRSLPAAERLALEVRAAAGDAARVGAGLQPGELDELIALAGEAARSPVAERPFCERVRAWHVGLVTALWADHEAVGKAYELGNFLADTSNRVVHRRRERGDEHANVADELRRVFGRDRVDRIERLLDDLQTRIDPAAARIVKQHLGAWRQAVQDREPIRATDDALQALDGQTIIWCQLVTADKEPESFIGHEERARVRGTLVGRMLHSYRRHWKAILMVAALAAAVVAVVPALGLHGELGPILAFAGSLAGVFGLSAGSVAMTLRKSLDARAELEWNTALAEVIGAATLRVDAVLAPPAVRRATLAMPTWPRGQRGATSARRLRVGPRAHV